MFVQVIRGKVRDAEGLDAAMRTWIEKLSPGATGWLGSTTGMTDDGTGIAIARFDSVENARRNSDRPEQGRWWADVERLFDGDVTFDESVEVDVRLMGDPDRAGFVQVMQGRVSDPERARAIRAREPEGLAQLRPDILGMIDLAHEEGRWTTLVYFTSEAEAREREGDEMPAELVELMQELGAITVGDITYFDLRRVAMFSPARAAQASTAGGAG